MTLKSIGEILVPDYSNGGKQYPLLHHKEWDEKVKEIVGGLTILKTAKGEWINQDGILFIDKMIPVRIYCTEFEIDKIIQLTLNHYDQEAVLAYEISSNVKLIKRK